MAKDRVIEINGYIEQYGYSMNYIKYMMNELGEGPITIKLTSLGGDVGHALKIKEIFATHGNVSIEYIGFNASSSTLIGHGAKETGIYEDSFYLIHKPMVWVDAWGSMNEDELAASIEEMQTQKKNAETVTLSIAQDYVNSRGMDLKVVMELMKEARWLSAKEAVEYGLVDKIIKNSNKKAAMTNQMVAMMKSSGLPIPEMSKKKGNAPENNLLTKISNGVDRLIENFTPKNRIEMNKTFLCLNKVLNVEGLEISDNKVSMTVEQMTAINSRLDSLGLDVTNVTNERDTAVTARETAETALANFTTAIDGLDTTVKAAADTTAKVEAVKAKLAARPGAKAEAPQGTSGANNIDKDDTDWEAINALEHNQEVDKHGY